MSKEKKYYTPKPEELHPGFELETNNASTLPIEEQKWKKIVCSAGVIKMMQLDLDGICPNGRSHEAPFRMKSLRVAYLSESDITSFLNERKDETGELWRLGSSILSEEDSKHPWQQFVLENNSKIIFNEGLHKIVLEKVYEGGKTKKVVFAGIVKNKSELKRIFEQTEFFNK